MTSKWNGKDRRVQDHNNPMIICKQEEAIKEISQSGIRTEAAIKALDLRINGTLEKMGVHVEDSIWWRKFIAGTAITLTLAIIGAAAGYLWMGNTLSYNLGQYAKQITINTERLTSIEKENIQYHHIINNGIIK